MLLIDRPKGSDIEEQRVELTIRHKDGRIAAKVAIQVTSSNEFATTVRRFEDDPTVTFRVI